MIPRVVVFDIDQTLTESKEPLTPGMAKLLAGLLQKTKVGIISGGKYKQFQKQIVEKLPHDSNLSNLFLLPTSGGALYSYANNTWEKIYEELLTQEEVLTISEVLTKIGSETELVNFDAPSYGQRIEFRGAQVSLSVLGQQAPIDEKKAWDPDHSKRTTLRNAAATLLPAFDVKVGGSNTIDVTKHGINKAYGVRALSKYLGIPISEMLYVGDALFAGGNDEVVKETGITTREVTGPIDTEVLIREIIIANASAIVST